MDFITTRNRLVPVFEVVDQSARILVLQFSERPVREHEAQLAERPEGLEILEHNFKQL